MDSRAMRTTAVVGHGTLGRCCLRLSLDVCHLTHRRGKSGTVFAPGAVSGWA